MLEETYTKGDYLEKNPAWHVGDSPWKAGNIARIMQKNDIHPKTVCEVGCGAGAVLESLRKLMPEDVRFYGYDISPQALEMCEPRACEGLEFHLKDLLEEDARFDVVMAIDVIEHVEDCFGFLRKLRERGEYQIYHIPLDLSVQTVLRAKPLINDRARIGHIHYFSKETALALLEDTGHEIVDWFYTCVATDRPAQSFKSRLLRGPRKLMHRLNSDLAARILGRYSIMVLTR